jgi:regulator of sigma E protease
VDLLYFVLLVGVLIFIHESGHFAMAKLFNVKVMTFSIGFGPKIVRLRGKETEYCVGVFPLGGFVKMLEETGATEPILPEDRKRTFEAQALWKRAVIVLAGPAMNLLFPVLLYTSVYLEDRLFLPPTVGRVLAGEPADGKLLAGDRILAVDGESVSSFPEVQRIVAKSAEQPLRMTVEREKRALDITVTPSTRIEKRELDIEERSGRIGFSPSFPAPVIGVPRPDSPAYKAGLRTFDRIVAINGRKVERFVKTVATRSSSPTFGRSMCRERSVGSGASPLSSPARRS